MGTSPVCEVFYLIATGIGVNAKGGINGHPVQLLIGDDGGNQARSVAVVRDFVENKGAIAISWSSVGVDGVANYAKSKCVPVIGVGVADPEWNQNPMLFPESDTYGGGGSWGAARLAKTSRAAPSSVVSK